MQKGVENVFLHNTKDAVNGGFMGFAGRFIAFEGIDQAGKKTQLERARDWLRAQGFPVVTGSEPNDNGPVGRHIRSILRHQRPALATSLELQRLYVLDRVVDMVCVIEPALEAGAVCLWERFHLSTFAYGEASPEAFKELHEVIAGSFLRWPDLTIVVDIPAEEALRRLDRASETPEYFETPERLTRARERYLDLARKPSLVGRVLVVNGERTPDEVFDDVRQRLTSVFSKQETMVHTAGDSERSGHARG